MKINKLDNLVIKNYKDNNLQRNLILKMKSKNNLKKKQTLMKSLNKKLS